MTGGQDGTTFFCEWCHQTHGPEVDFISCVIYGGIKHAASSPSWPERLDRALSEVLR